jgi:hypothetical protein
VVLEGFAVRKGQKRGKSMKSSMQLEYHTCIMERIFNKVIDTTPTEGQRIELVLAPNVKRGLG